MKVAAPSRIMPRRPTLSLTDPDSSWPSAMPTMNEVIVSCTTVDDVPSDRCTWGSEAR